jgi:carbamoyltransferase|tara:strand:+ start:23073 stop:24767 length:1695 start_codon:yes stop_codon:yes gene_type:complete
MAILGINTSGFHSSACLIVDGEIKCAITEERISRVKRDKNFPLKSIDYCCRTAGISEDEITDIYIGWNPACYMYKSDNTLNEALKDRGKIAYLSMNELSIAKQEQITSIRQSIESKSGSWDIHFVNHHEAHLSNSFVSSNFTEADFIIADGFGENTTGMCGSVSANSINVLSEFKFPHSLGSFYATFTEFLGFKPNGDEWKVMALASLGDPEKYYSKIKSLVKVSDIGIELDLSYFEYYLFFTEHYYSAKFVEQFGQPVCGLDGLTQYHYDLVAALQKVSEDVIAELLTNLHAKTGSNNLVVSGGFFMNSVMNGKLVNMTPYSSIYIGGSPDDSGISIGAALYGLVYDKKHNLRMDLSKQNYFGREYNTDEIIRELDKRKISYNIVKDVELYAARKISERNVVGWFQGKSEFGQRALGNRSILADPTCDKIKDIVNASIKYREGFRPFAPSVLEESQSKYFDNDQDSYFMEKVFMFKEGVRDKLPGVVHFDGTGRLQTVSKEQNPRYHRLIQECGKIYGFDIVLNTSFNINGMPLVESPADAINCFFQSGMDYLIMENVVVKKC